MVVLSACTSCQVRPVREAAPVLMRHFIVAGAQPSSVSSGTSSANHGVGGVRNSSFNSKPAVYRHQNIANVNLAGLGATRTLMSRGAL